MATLEQISEMSVADAKPLIAKLSTDDATKLRELEEAKGEDRRRKGVLEAIEARLAEDEKPAEKLTLEQRVDRIEKALAAGDPTAAAMLFA